MKKQIKTEHTKERILVAAIAEFGQNGYSNGSINRICLTGIPKGLIYHNFKNKDEIYLAVMQRCFKDFTEYMKNREIGTNLNAYFKARMEFLSENKNYVRIIFEAILQPPLNLYNHIVKIKSDFDEFNRKLYQDTFINLKLRRDVSEEDALTYFNLIQKMLNGYFGNMLFSGKSIEEIVEEHEKILPQLINNMLYGIVMDKK